MLALLSQKQTLAQGVLEGKDDLKTMELPSGRAAFMERMESLMGNSPIDIVVDNTTQARVDEECFINPDEVSQEEVTVSEQIYDPVDLLQVHSHPETGQRIAFAVVNEDINQVRENIQKTLQGTHADDIAGLEILDRNTFEIIQRLAQAGILTINNQAKTLYASQAFTESKKQFIDKQIAKAKNHLIQAERKHRMANILVNGEFTEEAVVPLREAITLTLHSFMLLHGTEKMPEKEMLAKEFVEEQLIEQHGLPKKVFSLIHSLHNDSDPIHHAQIPILLSDSQEIFQHVDAALKKASSG